MAVTSTASRSWLRSPVCIGSIPRRRPRGPSFPACSPCQRANVSDSMTPPATARGAMTTTY
eukprot:9458214-Lingulodinium_polyedra.AAC.1